MCRHLSLSSTTFSQSSVLSYSQSLSFSARVFPQHLNLPSFIVNEFPPAQCTGSNTQLTPPLQPPQSQLLQQISLQLQPQPPQQTILSKSAGLTPHPATAKSSTTSTTVVIVKLPITISQSPAGGFSIYTCGINRGCT